MKTRISNHDIGRVQSTPFAMIFFSIVIIVALIVTLINGPLFIAPMLLFMLTGCLVVFLLVIKLLKYLREAYIDDDYLYIYHEKTETKISLNNIQSLEYYWYPAASFEERWIQIKYLGENNKIEKVLIMPTQLDKGIFKFNRNIIWLIKDKMDKSKEKAKISTPIP